MDFWIFIAVFIVLYISILKFFNIRRDSFFRKIASQYNLQFQKPNYPFVMEKPFGFYPFRTLSGEIHNKKILIEDGVFNLLPSLGFLQNILPRPLFAGAYSKFWVDNQEVKDVYSGRQFQGGLDDALKGGLVFVAPKSRIQSFLKDL